MDLIQTNTNKKSLDLLPYLQTIKDNNTSFELPFAVGRDNNGNDLLFGLEKCPHLLVAGTTGSGKSVFVNNLILSLSLRDVGFVLIDVKQVEFSPYENFCKLAHPNSYDTNTAKKALKNVCYNMDQRYKLLKESKCRNIKEYNSKNPNNKLGYIITIIDELADLILFDKSIEKYIVRIAQLGRAAGFHLVCATQRPDAQILSGLLRANVPSRVCFRVQSATNSRIVLDKQGGEQLSGFGDGLFLPTGFQNPIRFQSPIISDEDFNTLVNN